MEEQRKLRSHNWFGRKDKDGIIYRSWMKNQGMPTDMFDGRPVIGICNTFSELTPCNAHFRDIAESVKRGVLEAGGFPLEFPIMSLGETLLKPTAMLFRNLASMDAEESIRGNPIDGVVLLTGCDKTTPSTIMGAASVGLPTIVVPGGPMLNGRYKGQVIGSGTHVWKFDEEMKTGKMTPEDCEFAESCMSRSIGHCMTMGTASTMACMVESLGLTLSGAAAIPAADSRKKVLAQLSGRRIVEMVKENLTIDKILTREAFENAIMVNAAVGGSSNFIIHLTAIAGRIGVDLKLDDFDTIGSKIPLLLNLMPSGKYLMEDFFYAGGLPVILNELKNKLHKNVVTVTGKNHHDNLNANICCYNDRVIASYEKPFIKEAGCVVVKGNLALNGAYVGPVGYPGMPEVGNMALPKKILEKGIKDMVRISDGRMSGTAYGTVVLHVSPESAIGGNLALVQNGDMIELDVEKRKLHLHVSDEELTKRRAAWVAPPSAIKRGYVSMYVKHVMGADKGADLDFLVGNSGSLVTRDSH